MGTNRHYVRDVFFDTLRPHLNLTTENVAGLEKVLAYAEAEQTPVEDLAYVLPTTWWETAQTMQPVKEAYWLSEDWRRRNLRYYPFYGRGLIQVTWEENYEKIAVLLGYPRDYFVNDPDLLLEWEFALPALFLGMKTGVYTGKALDDYIDDIDEDDDEDLREFINARRIVNGTDKASEIGRLALVFEEALRASTKDVEEAPRRQPDDPGVEPDPDTYPEPPFSIAESRPWLKPALIAAGVAAAFLAGRFWTATKWVFRKLWAGVKAIGRLFKRKGN